MFPPIVETPPSRRTQEEPYLPPGLIEHGTVLCIRLKTKSPRHRDNSTTFRNSDHLFRVRVKSLPDFTFRIESVIEVIK